MQDQTKQEKSNTWWIVLLAVLAAIALTLGALWAFGAFNQNDSVSQGPEIGVPPAEPGKPTGTALDAVNIRSGPGTQYPSYGVVAKGTTGELIGVSSSGGWWVVKMSTDIDPSGQGWASADHVKAENTEGLPVIADPTLPPEVPVPLPPISLPSATALDVVYIRSGPGVQYAAYGMAQKGATGEVIGVSEDGKWWVVRLSTDLVQSGQGWVSADWVETEFTENVPVIPAPPAT